MKKLLGVLLAVAAIFLLTGCQPTPETEAVTSKNDGTLEAALESTAEPADDTAEAQSYSHTDSFENTEGDISYTVDIEDASLTGTVLPVLRVTPHSVTVGEAQKVAAALFGTADIYEYSEEWTKAELEDIILSIRQRLSTNDETGLLSDELVTWYEEILVNYEAAYDTAPDTAEQKLCAWEFHPQSYYYDQSYIDLSDEEYESYEKTQYIVGTAERDGLPYIFSVVNRDEQDYRLHNITCTIREDELSEELIYSTEEPTDAEISAARGSAEEMLAAMDLGEWIIDSCEVQPVEYSLDGPTQYLIVVTACPVYDGVKLTHRTQLESLRTDDVYASNYWYTELSFTFSGERLISFDYCSPLDVVETVNAGVDILTADEAMEQCKSQLQRTILADDPYAVCDFYQAAKKAVTVTEVELGFARIRIQDNETDFYLVPAYTFRGDYTLYDEDGSVILKSEDLTSTGISDRDLAIINAVDGSIIDVSKGY